MNGILRSASFLPSCILAGVGLLFAVLASTLPVEQVVALIGGSAVAVGLLVARLRRHMEASRSAEPLARLGAES